MPPPPTRSDDHFLKLLDNRLEAQKEDIIRDLREIVMSEVKEEVKKIVESHKVEVLVTHIQSSYASETCE